MEAESIDALAEYIVNNMEFDKLNFYVLEKELRMELYVKIGNKSFEREDYATTIRAYAKADHKNNLIRVGNHCFERGILGMAELAYEKADHKEGIIRIGDKYFEKRGYHCALTVYEKAGHKEGLIKIGDCLFEERHRFDLIEQAYEKAKHKEGLIKLGDEYLKEATESEEKLLAAKRCYEKAERDDLTNFLNQLIP